MVEEGQLHNKGWPSAASGIREKDSNKFKEALKQAVGNAYQHTEGQWLDDLALLYGVDTFEDICEMFDTTTLEIPSICWDDEQTETQKYVDLYSVMTDYSSVIDAVKNMNVLDQMELGKSLQECVESYFESLKEIPAYAKNILEAECYPIPEVQADLSEVLESDPATVLAVMLSISTRTIVSIFSWFNEA